MQRYRLAGYVAVGRLGRNDLLNPEDAGLFRKGAQKPHWHIGLDVIHAHVADIAAVVFQVSFHVGDMAIQVNGDGHRPARVDRGLAGGLSLRHLPGTVTFGQVVQVGAQVGVSHGGFGGNGNVVAVVGGYVGDEEGQGDQQGEDGCYCQGPEVCSVGHGYLSTMVGIDACRLLAQGAFPWNQGRAGPPDGPAGWGGTISRTLVTPGCWDRLPSRVTGT